MSDQTKNIPQGAQTNGQQNANEAENPNLQDAAKVKATSPRSVIGSENEKIAKFINECPLYMIDAIRSVLKIAEAHGDASKLDDKNAKALNFYLNYGFNSQVQGEDRTAAMRKHRRSRMRELMMKCNRFLDNKQKEEIPYIVIEYAEREDFIRQALDYIDKK